MQHKENQQNPVTLGAGLFLGKVLANRGNCQKILLEIDRLVVSEENFGLVGNLAYNIKWVDDGPDNQLTGCFRQVFAPRNRLQELIQNTNEYWEAYIIDTKGNRKGSISTTIWDWGKNLPQIWQENGMFQFTKL